jgi:hypothetical protein
MDEICATHMSDIGNRHWKNMRQCSIIHSSPLFSSKKIDSSPHSAGFFFAGSYGDPVNAHVLSVTGDEDAIRIANRSVYGLLVHVFPSPAERALVTAQPCDAGPDGPFLALGHRRRGVQVVDHIQQATQALRHPGRGKEVDVAGTRILDALGANGQGWRTANANLKDAQVARPVVPSRALQQVDGRLDVADVSAFVPMFRVGAPVAGQDLLQLRDAVGAPGTSKNTTRSSTGCSGSTM